MSFPSDTPRRASWRHSGCTGPVASGTSIARPAVIQRRVACRAPRSCASAVSRRASGIRRYSTAIRTSHGVAREWAAPLSFRSVAQSETEKQARRKQKEKIMDIKKYIPNVFLKVDHVKASGAIRVKVTGISEGQYDKPNLAFNDGSQLSLNATNCRTLARAYGTESDDWIGKEVELTLGEIQYQGKQQEAILVKPISPPIENKASPKPDLNDEIPF